MRICVLAAVVPAFCCTLLLADVDELHALQRDWRQAEAEWNSQESGWRIATLHPAVDYLPKFREFAAGSDAPAALESASWIIDQFTALFAADPAGAKQVTEWALERVVAIELPRQCSGIARQRYATSRSGSDQNASGRSSRR